VYDEKVPNLVRALIGSFTRNHKHFHAQDASGYRFVANKMAEIDKINPQMAASLAGAFKIYTKLDETRSFGNIISFAYKIKKSICYLSVGQNVPDDLLEALDNHY